MHTHTELINQIATDPTKVIGMKPMPTLEGRNVDKGKESFQCRINPIG